MVVVLGPKVYVLLKTSLSFPCLTWLGLSQHLLPAKASSLRLGGLSGVRLRLPSAGQWARAGWIDRQILPVVLPASLSPSISDP